MIFHKHFRNVFDKWSVFYIVYWLHDTSFQTPQQSQRQKMDPTLKLMKYISYLIPMGNLWCVCYRYLGTYWPSQKWNQAVSPLGWILFFVSQTSKNLLLKYGPGIWYWFAYWQCDTNSEKKSYRLHSVKACFLYIQSIINYISMYQLCSLTHWGLVMPYGATDLGQHWFS